MVSVRRAKRGGRSSRSLLILGRDEAAARVGRRAALRGKEDRTRNVCPWSEHGELDPSLKRRGDLFTHQENSPPPRLPVFSIAHRDRRLLRKFLRFGLRRNHGSAELFPDETPVDFAR